MNEFYPFFLIVFTGVFFSMIFRRIHVPWVVALILGGILLGPEVSNILHINTTVEFMSEIGLIFLMFMAGLETKISNFKRFKSKLLFLSLINGIVPFIVGFSIGQFFGYDMIASLLIGIVFTSSSIAVVIPSLEAHKLMDTKLGQSVVITTIIQDILSLILLSVLIQNIAPVTRLPLYAFYPILILLLISLRSLLPKARKFFSKGVLQGSDIFQQEFRATFLILLGTVITFELLGVHPIISGFFAGLVLSESMTNRRLLEKVRTISYGVFIPTFFVLIGAQTDIAAIFSSSNNIVLALVLIGGSIFSKFISGWVGGRMAEFDSNQSLLFAITSIPQLSTTLAVAFTIQGLGIFDARLTSSIVALSIITVMVSPSLMSYFSKRIRQSVK